MAYPARPRISGNTGCSRSIGTVPVSYTHLDVYKRQDWDGNGTPGSGGPHDFFNDAPCQGLANDCFRYEEYGPIGPLGSSSARRVGFLVDPTVGDFRVKMILAADLGASGPITTGTIAGSVSSTLGAGIGSALITVSGGWAGTTARCV